MALMNHILFAHIRLVPVITTVIKQYRVKQITGTTLHIQAKLGTLHG